MKIIRHDTNLKQLKYFGDGFIDYVRKNRQVLVGVAQRRFRTSL